MTELEIIWQLGIRTDYKGVPQLIAALRIVHEQELNSNYVIKSLHEQVGRQLNSKPDTVARNITTVSNYCWEKGNRELLQKMAGRVLLSRPTAKDFVYILANYRLRQEYDVQKFDASSPNYN